MSVHWPRISEVDLKNFWRVTTKRGPDDCWEWAGKTTQSGYGRLNVKLAGGSWLSIRAHRFSYRAFVGRLRDGKCVCHRCDNRRCVNPAHLWLGSNLENTRDRDAKGRTAAGERAARSKLSRDDVTKILADKRPRKEIAKAYGVHVNTLWWIFSGRTWKEIPRWT